jgi:hypothetical protein
MKEDHRSEYLGKELVEPSHLVIQNLHDEQQLSDEALLVIQNQTHQSHIVNALGQPHHDSANTTVIYYRLWYDLSRRHNAAG